MKPIRIPATSRQTRYGKVQRGSTIIEFALVLPLLLAILIGIMEFGWLVKSNLTIANAAREGARTASLGKMTGEIVRRTQNAAMPFSVASPTGSVVMSWSNNDGADGYPYAVSDSTSQNAVLSGKLIRVTVTTMHRPLSGFFPFLRNRLVTGNAIMRRE